MVNIPAGTPTILLATSNPGKIREILHILAELAVKIETLADHPPLELPVEDADSFEGNARIKALHYARRTGCWTIADDSGLEVDALHGAPGVYSSRYAGPDAIDAANNAKLIAALREVAPERRTARFRCVAVLASPAEVLAVAYGTVEGRIVDQPRGESGFGYDPYFFLPEYGMTTAEMTAEQKNRISHRGCALRDLRAKMETLLAENLARNVRSPGHC